MTDTSAYDPPDYGVRPTSLRLLRLWREEWRLGVVGLACALVYTSVSIAIPVLVARAIDEAIVGDGRPLCPFLAAIAVLGIVRCGANFTRRYATARTGVRIEARIRELLY